MAHGLLIFWQPPNLYLCGRHQEVLSKKKIGGGITDLTRLVWCKYQEKTEIRR
jgi:hypothetical protein